MSIFVIGINHKTAPIALREQVYFALEKLPLYLQDLLQRGIAQEAVLLSTCNRSELYCEADNIEKVYEWFCSQTTASHATLSSAIYIYEGVEALTHIMEVACGLDAMILGEPQILGQMKEAFSESCTAGAVNAFFHRIFQEVFALAKEIRTTTAIGACPVSVASAAVHFAKQQYNDFATAKVVLIGAGDTAELLLRYLKNHLQFPVRIVNRAREKALSLVNDAKNVYGLEEMHEALKYADIIFSATGSALPLITKEKVKQTMPTRKRPLMLIDIAVPRDIDPTVSEVEQVELFCIDDLKKIIEKNRQGREHAAEKAREMIKHRSAEVIAETKSLEKVTHTIRAYRNQIEVMCRAELQKAKQQLQQGMDPIQVLDAFANAFSQKLMHTPSVRLRQAGAEGRLELLKLAKQLFAIPDAESERI